MTETFDPARVSYVTAIEAVRRQHPAPMTRATGKVLTRLDRHCRAIITLSPSGSGEARRAAQNNDACPSSFGFLVRLTGAAAAGAGAAA
jgi:hypothetical protein